MKSLHCIVKGDVRGGSFQGWVQKQAEQQGLTGWVRNVEDGVAEVLVQGDAGKFEGFAKLLETKSPVPNMNEFKSEIIDYENLHSAFEMRG